MASRRQSRKQEVSLFPFLDILACVIGNLILIITTVVLEQVDTKPVAEAASFDQIRIEALNDAEEARRLRQKIEELRRQQDRQDGRLKDARAALAEAERKRREAATRMAAMPKPTPPDERLNIERMQLQEKVHQIEKEIRQSEADIDAAKKKSEQSIVVLPSGKAGGAASNGPSRAVFVEVNAGGLTFYDGDAGWTVAVNQLAGDERFGRLREKLNADDQGIVTFLVRPDAIDVLRQAQQVMQQQGVRFGKVPLPGEGSLDLSKAK